LISAVIPTRGDVDLSAIRKHLEGYLEIDDIEFIHGTSPFNRYVAAARAKHTWIYTQDDDCITDIQPLIDAYEPGIVVNAMTEEHGAQYPGRITLVGFGALFHRRLIQVLEGWEQDSLFFREADRVFTALTQHKTVFPRIQILPCAMNDNRMYRHVQHNDARVAITRRIFERTGIVA